MSTKSERIHNDGNIFNSELPSCILNCTNSYSCRKALVELRIFFVQVCVANVLGPELFAVFRGHLRDIGNYNASRIEWSTRASIKFDLVLIQIDQSVETDLTWLPYLLENAVILLWIGVIQIACQSHHSIFIIWIIWLRI